MAHENIEINFPNFCIAPQLGTFATIDTSNPTSILRIKNASGGIVKDYALSANIPEDNEVISIDYVGPINISGPADGLTFFTLEKLDDDNCFIKRWELNDNFATLDLKEIIHKYSTGTQRYNAVAFAVEIYRTSFYNPTSGGVNYIDIEDHQDKIVAGDELILGPSTDFDNPDAIETKTVSVVVGRRVYFTTNFKKQYAYQDPITFYRSIYLISSTGVYGDTTRGTMYKLNPRTGGSLIEANSKSLYKQTTAAKWAPSYNSVAVVSNTNMFFIKPDPIYQIQRSMFMNNTNEDQTMTITIHDIAFDDLTVYKLMRAVSLRDDSGQTQTFGWMTYNYHQDTTAFYTNQVSLSTGDGLFVGEFSTTTLKVRVKDQYNFALANKTVNFYRESGDPSGFFTPINGQVQTDVNGYAEILYEFGEFYEGAIQFGARTDGSSALMGSIYVWDRMTLHGIISYTAEGRVFDNKFNQPDPAAFIRTKQIYEPFQIIAYVRDRDSNDPEDLFELTPPRRYLTCKSYFMYPGGDWGWGTENWPIRDDPGGGQPYSASFDPDCMPWAELPVPREDGPPRDGCTYSWKASRDGWGSVDEDTFNFPMNQVYVEVDFVANPLQSPGDIPEDLIWRQYPAFYVYDEDHKGKIEKGRVPDILLYQRDEFEGWVRLSQLKLSLHTYWADGSAYDELFARITINQFIFVAEAIPTFFSEKNTPDTYIWLRLLPYAYGLNADPNQGFNFYLREVWTEDDIIYDTGYYNINTEITTTYFDAGGGTEGVELFYQPPQKFHYGAQVYVIIEMYDKAPEPNFIQMPYWFFVVNDYLRPYLENRDPGMEETNVHPETDIYFEVKDEGTGVDIDSLEIYLNSRFITDIDTVEVSQNHYKITCRPNTALLYGKPYTVMVVVQDLSEARNMMRSSYTFYTRESHTPYFENQLPIMCKMEVPRFENVSYIVLADGSGIDRDTIILQVNQRDKTDKSTIVPIIYRIS